MVTIEIGSNMMTVIWWVLILVGVIAVAKMALLPFLFKRFFEWEQ